MNSDRFGRNVLMGLVAATVAAWANLLRLLP